MMNVGRYIWKRPVLGSLTRGGLFLKGTHSAYKALRDPKLRTDKHYAQTAIELTPTALKVAQKSPVKLKKETFTFRHQTEKPKLRTIQVQETVPQPPKIERSHYIDRFSGKKHAVETIIEQPPKVVTKRVLATEAFKPTRS